MVLASSMNTKVDTSVPENFVEAALTGAVDLLVHISFLKVRVVLVEGRLDPSTLKVGCTVYFGLLLNLNLFIRCLVYQINNINSPVQQLKGTFRKSLQSFNACSGQMNPKLA